MQPRFLLQIVDTEGRVVQLPGGGLLERDLIAACTAAILQHRGQIADTLIEAAVDAIVAKGVGLFTTEAHVADDIRAGLTEILTTEARDLTTCVTEGITEVIRDLKFETVRVA